MNELIYKKSKIKMKRRHKSGEKMEMIQRMCVEALNCYETSKKAFSKDPSELNNSSLQSSIKVIRRLQAKMTQELEKSQLQSDTNIIKYNTIIKDNIFNNSNNATLRNNFTSNTYSHSNSNVTMEKDRKRKQKQCRVFSGIPECPADNESYAVFSLSHSSTIRDFISSSSYNDVNKTNSSTTNDKKANKNYKLYERKRARSNSVKNLNDEGNNDSDDDNREENDDDDKLSVNDNYEFISMSHGDMNFQTIPLNSKQPASHQKQPVKQQKPKLQRLKYHLNSEAGDEVDYTDQVQIQQRQQNQQQYNFDNQQQQSQQRQINSPNTSIIAMDDFEFRFEDNTTWELPDSRFDDVERLYEHVTHVVVLMNYLLSNSQPASLFLVLLTNKTKKITKKESSTYLYSIYCLFLQSQAPLKVEVNANVIKAVETLLLDSTPDKIRQNKALEMLEEINSAAKPSLMKSMEKFRSLRQLGMGCMFGEEELLEGTESQLQRNKTVLKLLWPHFQQLSSEISEYSMCVTSCLDAFFKIINFTPPSLSSAKSSSTLCFPLPTASSFTSQPPSQQLPLNTQQPLSLPTTHSTPSDILPSSTPATAFIQNLRAERCTFPPLPNKHARTSSLHSLFSSTSSFFSSQSSSQSLSFSFLKFCSVLKEKSKTKISLWKDHYLKIRTYATPCNCHQCRQLVCSVGNYGVQCQKCYKNFHVTCLDKMEEPCGYEKFQKTSHSKDSVLGEHFSNMATGSKDKKNKFKDAKKNKRFQSLDYEFSTIHDKLKTEKTGNLKLMSNTHFISMKHLDGIEPRLCREADLKDINGNTSPEYTEDYDDNDDVNRNDDADAHDLIKNKFLTTTISNQNQIEQNISLKDINFNENGVDKNNYLITNNTDNNDNRKRNFGSDGNFDASKPHKREYDSPCGKDGRVIEGKNDEEDDDDLDSELDNLDTAVFVPVPYPMKELESSKTPILKKLSSILVQQTQQHMKDKEKRLSQRQAQSDIKELRKLHTINELVNTQQTHLRFLKKLHNIFFVPMYHNNEPDLVYLLFPNLEEVIAIHESLMNEFSSLEEVGGAELVWRLGHILNKHFSGEGGEHCKKVFTTFIRKQPLALEVLKSVLRKDEKFAAFMKKATENPLCSRLTLKDMLPYVVQRITKYPLLIDNIVKLMESTSSSPTCTEVYRKVFSSVKEIASHVNQAVMEFEGVYKLTALQSLFIKKPINHLTCHAHLPYVDLYKKFDFTEHKHVFDGPLTWFISPTHQNDLHCVLMQDLLVLLHKQRQPTKDKETSASIAILGDLSSPNSTIMSDKNAHNAGGYYNVRSMAKNKNKTTNYVTNLVLTYQSVIGSNNNSNKNNDNPYHVSRLLTNETNNKKYSNSKNNNSSQANSGNKKMNLIIGNKANDVITKHSPVLKITDVMIKPVHEEPCMFYLVCKSDLVTQIYTMVASSKEEKNAWCKRITQTRQVYEENVVYNASFYYGFDGRSKKEDAMEGKKSERKKNNLNEKKKNQKNNNKDDFLKNSLKSEDKGNVGRVRDDDGTTNITVNNNKNNHNNKHVDNNNNINDNNDNTKADSIEIIVPLNTKSLGSNAPIHFEDNNLDNSNNITSNNVNNNHNHNHNNNNKDNKDDIDGVYQIISGDERTEIDKNNKEDENKNNGDVRRTQFDNSMTITLKEILHEFNDFVAALDTIVTKEDKETYKKEEEKQENELNNDEELVNLINRTNKTYKINNNSNNLVSTKDLLEWSNKPKDQFKSLMGYSSN